MGIKRHKPEEIVTKLRQVEVLVGQGAAHFIKLFLVVYQFLAGITGHRIIFLKKDGFFRANFLAIPAVNASEHIDLELFGSFFHVRSLLLVFRYVTGGDTNCLWWTNELAQLARNAFFSTIRILHQSGDTSVTTRDRRTLLGILESHLLFEKVGKRRLQARSDLWKISALGKRERFAFHYDCLDHRFVLKRFMTRRLDRGKSPRSHRRSS